MFFFVNKMSRKALTAYTRLIRRNTNDAFNKILEQMDS